MDLSAFQRKLARLPGAAVPASGPATGPAPAAEPIAPPIAPAAAPDDAQRLARIATLRSLLGELEERQRARPARARAESPVALLGERIDTAHGPLHRRRIELLPDHAHGRVPVARALSVSAPTLAGLALDPALATIDPRRVLYLDTETTGLSGGTGTLPFLVGMAFFEDESLVVEQLLLHRPGEEKPMLHALRERMERASAVVTYNGKSFDWPLLRTRAVMNRVPLPPPAVHLDLYPATRRVVGQRVGKDAGGVRLVHVEREVLGLTRHGDIDGAEIPERFWAFVRGADASGLVPVLEHNANDLVALAAILVALAERWDAVLPSHAPEDVLGVARTALRAGDTVRAGRWAEAASEAGGDDALACEALRLAAHVHRRHADPAAALDALDRALVRASNALAPRLELERSKLLEHRLRAFEPALDAARGSAGAEPPEAHARRLARLAAKLRKASRA